MGGDPPAPRDGVGAPTSIVAALRDPIGANPDPIQVVKGWMDTAGALKEQVCDVVWSGDRDRDAETGALPPVGSTVDGATATHGNAIGTPELLTMWSDPDFDAAQSTFSYARVLETPTPRRTAFDATRLGTAPLEGTRMTIVERSYTAPI